MNYPFVYLNSFLIKINVSREPIIPEGIEFQFETKMSITKDKFPEQIQVNFILQTPDTSSFKFYLETVGMYKYTGSNPDTDKGLIEEYVFNIVVPSLYPTFLPILRSTASFMGVNGINLQLPGNFTFTPIDE